MTDHVGYRYRPEDQPSLGAQTHTAQTMMPGVPTLVAEGLEYVSMPNGEGADENSGIPASIGASKTPREKDPFNHAASIRESYLS